jgi:hypothetical protein
MSNAVTNTNFIALDKALEAAGAVNGAKAEKVIETFNEVRAMTWRLLNPKN